jgi:hypothetical protein
MRSPPSRNTPTQGSSPRVAARHGIGPISSDRASVTSQASRGRRAGRPGRRRASRGDGVLDQQSSRGVRVRHEERHRGRSRCDGGIRDGMWRGTRIAPLRDVMTSPSMSVVRSLGPIGLLLAAGLLTAACAERRTATTEAPQEATAELRDGQGRRVGSARLRPEGNGVRIVVEAEGLTPGPHGIHLHATGRCEGSAFTSAGDHLNPLGKQHGLSNPAGRMRVISRTSKRILPAAPATRPCPIA